MPKDYIEIRMDLDIIDFERGAKVAGYRGYYLKGDGVSLTMALMMYALYKMISKGFAPMIPPTLVKEFALFGSGYLQYYRSEIGSYGKDTKGMYHVHEFMKIEQVVLAIIYVRG